jgi:magnesium chelatase family protein
MLLVPAENTEEAAVVKGLKVYAIDNLRQAVTFLEEGGGLSPVQVDVESVFGSDSTYDVDFSDVKGQPPTRRRYGVPRESAKRAMEVAVSGGHNSLMIGPPGTGMQNNVELRC